jgi:hypothetical protein
MPDMFKRFRECVPTQNLVTDSGAAGLDLSVSQGGLVKRADQHCSPPAVQSATIGIKELLAKAKLRVQSTVGDAAALAEPGNQVSTVSPFTELLIPTIIACVAALAALLPLAQWQNNILITTSLFTLCILWRMHVILGQLSSGFYPIKPREVVTNSLLVTVAPLICLFGLPWVLPCIGGIVGPVLTACFSIAAVYCLIRHDWQTVLSRVGKNWAPGQSNLFFSFPIAFAIVGISSFADISNLRFLCAVCLLIGLANILKVIRQCARTSTVDLIAEGILGEWEGNGNRLAFYPDGRADYLSILERRSIFSGAVTIKGQTISICTPGSQHVLTLTDLKANYEKTGRIPNIDQLRQKQLNNLGLLTEERRPSNAPSDRLPIIVPTIGNFLSFADHTSADLNQHFARLLMPFLQRQDSDLAVLSQPAAALLNFLQCQSSSIDPVWAMHKLVECLRQEKRQIRRKANSTNRLKAYGDLEKCETAFFCAITYGASAIIQGRAPEVFDLFVEIGSLTSRVLGEYHELWAYSQWNIGWLTSQRSDETVIEIAKENIHKYVIGSPISIGSPVGEPGTRCLKEPFYSYLPQFPERSPMRSTHM